MGKSDTNQELPGGCACGAVRYRMTAAPMFVHCCHCTWCQRESGSAFALNAMIEADNLELTSGELEVVDTPSESGRGQKFHRCPECKIAVWGNYAGAGDKIAFLRVGTLDEAHKLQPDIHIYTSTKQEWVTLPENVPASEAFYDPRDLWPAEAQARFKALKEKS